MYVIQCLVTDYRVAREPVRSSGECVCMNSRPLPLIYSSSNVTSTGALRWLRYSQRTDRPTDDR